MSRIIKEFWYSGLGTQMMKLMLSTAKEAGYYRVNLTVRPFNIAGIKLYEKVCSKRISLLKDAVFIDGEYIDEFTYQNFLN